MTFRVQSDADAEFAESALWYLTEEQSPQAAERFADEIEDTYLDIQKGHIAFRLARKD